MPTASVPNNFVAGQPARASEVNSNFSSLVNLLNNGLDQVNLAAGSVGNTQLAVNAVSTDRIQNNAVTAAKINDGAVTDAKVNLTSAAIPALDASKISSGTLADARIPNLNASKITAGTLNVDRIPALDADKITTGTFPPARLDRTYLETAGGTVTGAVDLQGQIRTSPGSNLTGTSIVIDLSGPSIRTATLSGTTTFSASNHAAGRSVTLRVVAGASNRSFNFPSTWKFVGFKPLSIPANKVGVLAITSFGSSESDVVAAWSAEI